MSNRLISPQEFVEGFTDRLSQPYQSHSETSKAAAVAIEPSVGSLEGKVLAILRIAAKYRQDGFTDEEGITELGINPSTYRPRRVRLLEKGLVRDAGYKRMTQSGRQAVVWIAV